MTIRAGGNPSIGYNESWYYATAKGLKSYPRLTEMVIADVCIIGAGYTGLSAAIHLARKGYSVAVLEAHRVGSGASGRNGGVLGMGQRKDQEELEEWLGIDDAKRMWQIAYDANQLVRDLIEEFIIDCELNKVLSCAYSDGGLGRMDAGDDVGVLSTIQNMKDDMSHVWSW